MIAQIAKPVNPSPLSNDLRILWLPAIFCLVLLAAEFYVLLHNWDSSAHSDLSGRGEPIASYLSGKKIVRQKTVGTLVWEAPTPSQLLFREDAIATMDDSEAVLVFKDHSELVVESNSLVILEEAPTDSTGAGKIVARLVKGSIKRRNTGSSSFFIKLSRSKDAPPIEITDTRGGAVFRVVYRLSGYEVLVESGGIVVNGANGKNALIAGQKLAAGEPVKLMAPRLKKAKVEILDPAAPRKKPGAQFFQKLFQALWPEAEAAELPPSGQIAIHFFWEPTPGASSYVIQISKSPDFSRILSESRTPHSNFRFKTPALTEKSQFYFRVAGVSGDGNVGEFSAIETVEVTPQELEIAASSPPTPAAPATKPPEQPASPMTHSEVTRAPSIIRQHAWFWYGAQLDHRTLKNSGSTGITNPTETSGGGFVPARLGMELQRAQDQSRYFSIGGTYLYERAHPKLPAQIPSQSDSPLSTSALRAWITFGKSFEAGQQLLTYHFGPYAGSSSRIRESGLLFGSETIWMFGGIAALQNVSQNFSWRFQLAVLPIGTLGADASGWLRKTLVHQGPLHGTFAGLEIETRQTTVESSYGAALEMGFGI